MKRAQDSPYGDILNAPQLRHEGLPSVIVAAIAFALVLLLVGGFGPFNTRRLQMVTALVMTVAIGGLTLIVARRQGLGRHVGYLMLLVGVFYWYVSPAFFLSLNPDVTVTERHGLRLSPESVAKACVFVAGYVLFGVVGYWFCYGRMLRRLERGNQERIPRGFFLMVVGLFLAGFLPYMIFGGGLENILHALKAGRSTEPPWKSGPLGDHRSALYYISRSGMVGAAGFAGSWAILAKRSRERGVLLAIFLAATLLVFFDGGTRSWVALAVLPTMLTWLAFRFRHRMTLGNIMIAVLVLSTTQFAFEFARASRNLGWNMKALKSIDPIKREFDNDFFSELVVSVDLVPRRHAPFHFGDVWAFVAHPIPRFLWPEKPISPILLFYNDVAAKGLLRSSANKLPSHIGQFYMSFGVLGVAMLGLLSGVISAMASALLQSSQVRLAHLGGAIATWWFLMARGVYPAWTYVILFAWLICAMGFRTAAAEPTELRS